MEDERHDRFDSMVREAFQSQPVSKPSPGSHKPAKRTIDKPPKAPKAAKKLRLQEDVPPPPPNQDQDNRDNVPPSQPPVDESSVDVDAERTKLWHMIERYSDAFECCNIPDTVTQDSSVDALKLQLSKFQRKVAAQQEVGMLRTGLIAGCGLVETGASFIPNKPIKLTGLATNVEANIEQFDSVLKQLSIKYMGETTWSVEATFLALLGRIVVQTHLANVLAERMANSTSTSK